MIFIQVATVDTTKAKLSTRKVREDGKVTDVVHDLSIEKYWEDRPISRKAKTPLTEMAGTGESGAPSGNPSQREQHTVP